MVEGNSCIPGRLGLALAIVAGIYVGLGVLLAYWISVDWLTLRVIRKALRSAGSTLHDGELVALTGTVRIQGQPMTAPFKQIPCAAYMYVVATSPQSSMGGGSRRQVMAQGFHMVKTRIETDSRTLGLRSFPGFEDELRENLHGREWAVRTPGLAERISVSAQPASERERQARLLEVRHREFDKVHQDYCCMGAVGGSGDGLVIDEEVLPIGQDVYVIGAYDATHRALIARRPRLGGRSEPRP